MPLEGASKPVHMPVEGARGAALCAARANTAPLPRYAETASGRPGAPLLRDCDVFGWIHVFSWIREDGCRRMATPLRRAR